jgi:NADH-quinone oxidoreductase subunit C
MRCCFDSHVAHGELTLTVALQYLVALVEFLRDDAACRFSTLVDITAVDHPERERSGSTWSTTSCRCTRTTASG